MKKVVIVGSAKKGGDTSVLANKLAKKYGWDVIDLNDYSFSYYDYEHLNRDDDFLPLMRQIIETYDTLIFATPVYWYSMSGIMKVFFDRLSDLITIEKEMGRQMKGKKMAVLTSSSGNNLGEHFWLPFKESANYFAMEYLGDMHTIYGEYDHQKLDTFIEQVENEGVYK